MEDILSMYINALRPILYIKDPDFYAVDNRIRAIACGARIFEYSNAYGGIDFETKSILQAGPPSLFSFLNLYKDAGFDEKIFIVLKDIHAEINDPQIIAAMRHIAERTMNEPGYFATIFIVSAVQDIPKELGHLITLVPGVQPDQNSIESLIRDYARTQNFSLGEKDIGELALEMKGLPEFQIGQVLNLAYCHGGAISFAKDRALIFAEKKQMVEKAGLLEFIESRSALTDVGGLDGLKAWLCRKAQIFKNLDRALKYGVDRPKGVLILGMPGCGKSLTAKTTASLFGTPLARLDVGRLLGKYVGESEKNMREALHLAEAISPCVLWIDEIEKAFAGGAGGGHEVTVRLIGQFLTWMQEKKNTVFVVATANNIKNLPPEFLRKGRFDEVFSVDLPCKNERQDILKIHLQKRNQFHTGIDFPALAKKTEKFSGADLESVASSAIEAAFIAGERQVRTEHIMAAVGATKPLAVLLEAEIKEQEEKLKSYKTVNASAKPEDQSSLADETIASQQVEACGEQFGIPYENYILLNTHPHVDVENVRIDEDGGENADRKLFGTAIVEARGGLVGVLRALVGSKGDLPGFFGPLNS
jgi:AAA+ superfamily predicted ATPase